MGGDLLKGFQLFPPFGCFCRVVFLKAGALLQSGRCLRYPVAVVVAQGWMRRE